MVRRSCRPWSLSRHRSYGSQARWMQCRDAAFGRRRRRAVNKGRGLRRVGRGAVVPPPWSHP